MNAPVGLSRSDELLLDILDTAPLSVLVGEGSKIGEGSKVEADSLARLCVSATSSEDWW